MIRFRALLLGGCLFSAEVRGEGEAAGTVAKSVQSEAADARTNPDVLMPFRVTAPAYKFPLSPIEKFRLNLFLKLSGFGLPFIDGSFVLTPERVPQASRNAVSPVAVFEGDVLRAIPSLELKDAMLSAPELMLDRADGGRVVSASSDRTKLRGLEMPLTLLDGVPLNDSWDGSVRWNEVPREGLFRAEVVAGGGAVVWGEATAGVMQFFRTLAMGKLVSVPVPPELQGEEYPMPPKQVVTATGQLAATVGDYGTRTVEFVASQPTRTGVLQVLGRAFSTDGFSSIAPERTGIVDTRTWARHHWLETRWRQPLGKQMEVTATVRGIEESHGLGTAYQDESSHGVFASVALAGFTAGDFKWNGTVYVQAQRAEHSFSAVDDARTTETPAIEEFARPATAWGASWIGSWSHSGNNRTNIGADVRSVHGESRSDLAFINGVFTRERIAGGQQDVAGVFVMHHRRLTASSQVSIGMRIDEWRDASGHAGESDRVSGAKTKDEKFSDKSGDELSPTIGVVSQLRKHWLLRANLEGGFRRPTLSERYGELGQNSLVLEPNHSLRIEHRMSAQVGVEYSAGDTMTLSTMVFANELRDAIGSRAIVRGSSESALLKGLPADYEGRTWINLDRARVRGVQLSARWRPQKTITFDAGLLFYDTNIRRVALAPQLEGNEMAGVPHQVAVMNAAWQPSKKLSLRMRVRFLGREFADEENTRRLGEAALTDLGAYYSLNSRTELFFTIENLGDTRIENARGASGVTYRGSPRMASGGVRVAW